MISGFLWKEFMVDKAFWSSGESGQPIICDYQSFFVNGESSDLPCSDPNSLNDGDQVRIISGDVFEQSNSTASSYNRVRSLIEHFELWREQQDFDYPTLIIPKKRTAEVEAVLRDMGIPFF